MKLSLRAKLALAFGALLVLTSLLGGVALMQMNRINTQATIIAQNWLPSVDAVHRVNTLMVRYRVGEYAHILATDTANTVRIDKYLVDTEASLKTAMADYQALMSMPEERAIFDTFSAALATYLESSKRITTMSRQNQKETASRMTMDSLDEFNAIVAELAKLVDFNTAQAQLASETGTQTYATSLKVVFAVIALALVIGIGTAIWLIRDIMRALGGEPDYARDIIREIAAGNLDIQVATRKDDEESLLAAARDMVAKLNEVIAKVMAAGRNVDTGSQELSAAAEQLSQGSTEQASSTEEASSAME
ncbi:HAMP domain-containing methyl-accepting chemotaxis protein, partial [Rhodobacter maris]